MSAYTPFTFAREECANWIAGQGCLIHDDCKCVLAAKQPCGYFEGSLLPLMIITAKYGRIEPQYNRIKVAWAKGAHEREKKLLASFGRREGVKAPRCTCLNCRNGYRQMCLCAMKIASPAVVKREGRIVTSYCRQCKAPIYKNGLRYCSEECRRKSAKARKHTRLSKRLENQPVNIERSEAFGATLALQPKDKPKEDR